MVGAMTPIWQNAVRVFDERADDYDRWFVESVVFDIELKALLELKTSLDDPRIEVGVGPGRFAEKLGVVVGVDPALAALRLAGGRLNDVCQGVGENLPIRSASMGTAFLLLTLCFTQKPSGVIAELSRILKPGGHLVLGVVPRMSPWGESLRRKKREGHPFYLHSHLHDRDEVLGWLVAAGLAVVEERSTLFQVPDEVVELEESKGGFFPQAGFLLIVAEKMA